MSYSLILLCVGFLVTWFVGAFGRFAATYFVREEVAPISGFSLAVGFVLAGGFDGVKAHNNLEQAAINLGMIAGLAILWFRYFKREKADG